MLHSSIYKNNKDKYIYIRIYFLGVKVNFAPVHTNRSDNFRSLKKESACVYACSLPVRLSLCLFQNLTQRK